MRTNYIIFQIRFHLLRKGRISIGVYGKYRAVRHIPCAFGVNIDLLDYPLIHRRRDDGPPSPQSSAKPSGRRLVLDNFQLTEVNDAAAMLCPTRLFDSSGRTIFIDEREGYSSSRTSLAFSAIIAPAEPLVTLPKSKR